MSRVRRVGILGHPGRPAVRRATAHLASGLLRRGLDVELDERLAREMDRPGQSLEKLGRWCDILITLGGDGTALRGARALARKKGVLLPVNLGGLGFLTIAEEPQIGPAVRAALREEWNVGKRRLIEATVIRSGRTRHRGLAMNDVVLKAAGGYAAVHFRLHALGSDLGHLVADGLIAASASGSTAYSLSAGGPVVSPQMEALIVTPVCPHTLGSRSLVLGGRDALAIRVLGAFGPVALFFDGQESVPLEPADEVNVALARATVRVFENPAKPLARALRSKLGWQGSERRSFS